MRKAVATFGIGAHRELLGLVMPTFLEFAARYGYEVIVGTGESAGRPVSWGKVLLLQRLLREYDFVLWLDADLVILDSSVDLVTTIPHTAFQALPIVAHGWNQGPLPNCGLWGLRGTEMSHRFLSEVWAQDDLIDHPHWEQAAAMRILGWVDSPYRKATETEWDEGTYYLPEEWDVMPIYPGTGYAQGLIRHYGGMSNLQRPIEIRTDLAEIAANSHTGLAKIPPLLRHQLGRAMRVPEVQLILKRLRRAVIDPTGVLERRLGASFIHRPGNPFPDEHATGGIAVADSSRMPVARGDSQALF